MGALNPQQLPFQGGFFLCVFKTSSRSTSHANYCVHDKQPVNGIKTVNFQ